LRRRINKGAGKGVNPSAGCIPTAGKRIAGRGAETGKSSQPVKIYQNALICSGRRGAG